MSALKVGALFAGYGGIELALASVLDTAPAWFSEFDKAPSAILAHHWPDVPNLGDVTKIDWAAVEPVDIITGGSPCQDLSHAGKRAGMKAGTRSGLWASMCDAIDIIRPRLVVWENVRGALSAAADSSVEPCPFCVGDDPGVTLRALGRVLGDLAELGYDASWYGLRAADVGAAHGRFRVFLFAQPADADHSGLEGLADQAGAAPTGRHGHPVEGAGGPAVAHVPGQLTLRTETLYGLGAERSDANRPQGEVLLPTPRATDGTKGGPNQRGSSGDLMLPSAVNRLLPTVTSQAAKHYGNDTDRGPGSPDDANLWIIAQRMWGTDADTAEASAAEELRDMRNTDGAQAVREAPRGHGCVPAASPLLPVVREHTPRGDEGRAALASEEAQGDGVCGVCHDCGPACASQRPEPGEQRPGEPDDALLELPPTPALAGGPAEADGSGEEGSHNSSQDWRDYEAAIRRWEIHLGRPAPDPTELTAKGTHRLSARFCEWLMGLPEGHVTDVPGISRNDMLKALGNGVCPPQCAAALRAFLADTAQERVS